VAEGGLTDGEPLIFLLGNPTRNTGKFYRAMFGSDRKRWKVRSIDSRQCSLPNKAQIEEWIHDYGEDSADYRAIAAADVARTLLARTPSAEGGAVVLSGEMQGPYSAVR
jgi:hypothetical protein